jgi:hypothetical protein
MNAPRKSRNFALLFLVGAPIFLALLRLLKSKLRVPGHALKPEPAKLRASNDPPAESIVRNVPPRSEPKFTVSDSPTQTVILESVQVLPKPLAPEPFKYQNSMETAAERPAYTSEAVSESEPPAPTPAKKWTVLLLFLIGVPFLIFVAWFINPKPANRAKSADNPPTVTRLSPATPAPSISATASPATEQTHSKAETDMTAPGVPAGRSAVLSLKPRSIDNAHPTIGQQGKESKPEDELRAVYSLLSIYQRAYNSLPVAENNAQVVNALAGNNPDRIAFIERTNSALNANGEIVDRWGQPYVFIFLSRTDVEIISTGPSHELGAPDNIVFATPNAAGIKR